MIRKTIIWIVFILYCNVILFVLCGLPWYVTLLVSYWYCLIAIPANILASIFCGEAVLLLHEELDDDADLLEGD